MHVSTTDSSSLATPLLLPTEKTILQDDLFEEHPCGSYRGLAFVILFDIFLVVCGTIVFLIVHFRW